MKMLITILLLLLLYIAFNVGALIVKIRRSMRQFQENIRQQAPGSSRRGSRTTTTSDGVTIIDHRDPSEANKKIFSHDEGEYVDFKEET